MPIPRHRVNSHLNLTVDENGTLTKTVYTQLMNRPLILMFVSFVFFGCASTSTVSDDSYQDEVKAIHEVDASDGIDQSEAYVIAKTMFYSSPPIGLGMAPIPHREGNSWVSETAEGFFAEPGEPIYVDRETGTATWKTRDDGIKSFTLDELKAIQFKSK